VRLPAAASPAPKGYDSVTRATHWFVAGLAVIVVALGWAITETPRNTPSRDFVLLLHRSVGLAILATMVFRGGWVWRHPAPPLPASVGRFERRLARSTHLVLYVIFIVMPVLGYVNAAAAGHPVDLFGVVSIPPLVPENDRLSQFAIAGHLVGQYLVYFFVALHVVGALWHGILKRDRVLERMLPVRRTSPIRRARE